MGKAGRFAGDGAQPEALVSAEVGRLQPAIVEHQRLALAVFEIKLAVVGAVDRVGDDLAHALVGNVELREKAVHRGLPRLKSKRSDAACRRLTPSRQSPAGNQPTSLLRIP